MEPLILQFSPLCYSSFSDFSYSYVKGDTTIKVTLTKISAGAVIYKTLLSPSHTLLDFVRQI